MGLDDITGPGRRAPTLHSSRTVLEEQVGAACWVRRMADGDAEVEAETLAMLGLDLTAMAQARRAEKA